MPAISFKRLNKLIHSSWARVSSRLGLRIKFSESSANIINCHTLYPEGTIEYENVYENQFYKEAYKRIIKYKLVRCVELKDIFICGSEGFIFTGGRDCLQLDQSLSDKAEKTIRRPIPWLSEKSKRSERSEKSEKSEESQKIKDPLFILMGRAPGNRGHFLIEHLPRILLWLKNYPNCKNYKILLTPKHRKWQSLYLEKLGIDPNQLIEGSEGSVGCSSAVTVPNLGY